MQPWCVGVRCNSSFFGSGWIIIVFTYLLEAFVLGLLGSVAGVGVGQILAMGSVGTFGYGECSLFCHFGRGIKSLLMT